MANENIAESDKILETFDSTVGWMRPFAKRPWMLVDPTAIYVDFKFLSNPGSPSSKSGRRCQCGVPMNYEFPSHFFALMCPKIGFPLAQAVFLIGLLLKSVPLTAADAPPGSRGYEILRTHQFLPPDLDDEIFAALWTVWPEPDRANAEAADVKTRRRLTLSYYGMMQAPDDPEEVKPALGYVSDGHGNWIMNCLACHGGKVAGRVIPGLPNSHIALHTLSEDIRSVKMNQGKPLSHLDLGSLQMPLNFTDGSTNAVVFGIVLGAYRKPDMSVDLQRKLPPLLHHDVDAPPFWNVRKKRSLYADGFAPKTARPLMQFIMLPRVTPQQLAEWEPDFAEILGWIESLEPPKYPFEIDHELALRGEQLFNKNCSKCHGTYGPQGEYNQKTVAIDELGTDSLRLSSLSPEHRNWMKTGWLSHFGQDPVEIDPIGYVAPPLNGIWASGPYLHNGSVPTLWHLLHPDSRPAVWKRTEDGYDRDRVGLEVVIFDRIPSSVKIASRRRRYFDTKLPGKSSAGHRFPDVLDEIEKKSVLEYLKTL